MASSISFHQAFRDFKHGPHESVERIRSDMLEGCWTGSVLPRATERRDARATVK